MDRMDQQMLHDRCAMNHTKSDDIVKNGCWGEIYVEYEIVEIEGTTLKIPYYYTQDKCFTCPYFNPKPHP